VQWNNIKESVLHIISDLVGKVERRSIKQLITQEMISIMDEKRNGRMSTMKKSGKTTGG
jgi:hypothetical protein